MGRGTLRLRDALPAIAIESFSEEAPQHSFSSVGGGALVRSPSPQYPLVDRLWSAARHLLRRYELAVGAYRDFDPRTASSVEHRVERGADAVVASLRRDGSVAVDSGRLLLAGDRRRVGYDPYEHEYRIAARLALPWSWPRLPVVLAVGERSSSKSVLRLSLRSRRRIRYPRRYFSAAHTLLDELETQLLKSPA